MLIRQPGDGNYAGKISVEIITLTVVAVDARRLYPAVVVDPKFTTFILRKVLLHAFFFKNRRFRMTIIAKKNDARNFAESFFSKTR